MTMALPRGVGGYALRWGEWSRPMAPENAAGARPASAFRERFAPESFRAFLARLATGAEAVELLDGHHGGSVARTRDGTLAVWADQWGLAFAAHLPGDPRFPSVPVSVSFAASPGGVSWQGGDATVKAAELRHIALLAPRELHAGPQAYAGAVAWFDGWPGHAVPPAVASVQARHRIGRLYAVIPRPPARKVPVLPPRIVAMLAEVERERALNPLPPLWWVSADGQMQAMGINRPAIVPTPGP